MRFIAAIIFISLSFTISATPLDSLRTENIEGKLFIIHQVESKETLFSLSRRYNVPVDEIKKNNPLVASEGLKIGDLIRIPFFQKTEIPENAHIVAQGETLFAISQMYGVEIEDIRTLNDLPGNDLVIGQALIIPKKDKFPLPVPHKLSQDTAIYDYHVVAQGETLFALSQLYDKEVDELKRWNSLNNNSINIGDTLVVGYTVKLKTASKANEPELKSELTEKRISVEPAIANDPEKNDPEKNDPEKKEPVKSNPVASTDKEVQITREIVANDANYMEVVETGLAELIENSGDTKKYLALHRTAKIGTIIRVHNEMNGQEVFVRVLGKLPDTGVNDKVLIKISQAAFDRLAAIDKKFRVRISYFPD